jgi:hypothetical protein
MRVWMVAIVDAGKIPGPGDGHKGDDAAPVLLGAWVVMGRNFQEAAKEAAAQAVREGRDLKDTTLHFCCQAIGGEFGPPSVEVATTQGMNPRQIVEEIMREGAGG